MPLFSRRQSFALIAELPERGGDLRRVFQPLDAPETDIGRGVPRPGAGSLQLPQLWVSRCHATIRRSEDDNFYLHVHGRAGCDVARKGSSQHLGCADAPWLLRPQDEVFICGGPASDRMLLNFVELFSNDDAAIWWCEELKSDLQCVVESPAKPNGCYAVAAQLPQRVWHGSLEALEDLRSHANEAGQETQCEFSPSEQSRFSSRRRCALMGGMLGRKDARLFVALDAAWTDIGRSACPGPNVLQLTHAWVSRQHARIRRVEDENGAVYSVLVESRLGIDVLRNGQQHHLPKASPPWQLLSGDVITFRSPPSVTSPQQSIELRFVDVFSRADAAIYRGDDGTSANFPCVVDSGPWPDGTYDVRIRAEAWHGHLKVRVAEVAEEEPMTQLQDCDFAETQSMDDFGGGPVLLPPLSSMLPPPPPRPARKADGTGASEDVHVTDPTLHGGHLAGLDVVHDDAEGLDAKRPHLGSEVDVGVEEGRPKKALRLHMPESSGAAQGTPAAMPEQITPRTAEQQRKCVTEKAPAVVKRHREDEGCDGNSHKSARFDMDMIVEADDNVRACGMPPESDDPANSSQCKSADVANAAKLTDVSAESAISTGGNAIALEADSSMIEEQQSQKKKAVAVLGQADRNAQLLVEQVTGLRATPAITPFVTSSETPSKLCGEPATNVAMRPSAPVVPQQSPDLLVREEEQPVEQPIEHSIGKLVDQPAVEQSSTPFSAQPRTALLAQPPSVQPLLEQISVERGCLVPRSGSATGADATAAVETASEETSELPMQAGPQELASAPFPCASTPQRGTAGTACSTQVVASPNSSEKMPAPGYSPIGIDGADVGLPSAKEVSAPLLKVDVREINGQQAHGKVSASMVGQPDEALSCAGPSNGMELRSVDKDSERSFAELPVRLRKKSATEPMAKPATDVVANHVAKSVAELTAVPSAKPSVDPNGPPQEHASAQRCAQPGSSLSSSPLSRQSAQLFLQPVKQPCAPSPAQPLASPLSTQPVSFAEGSSLKNSQSLELVVASSDKNCARSQPQQDVQIKEAPTQALPTQVVPTKDISSQGMQAIFVEASGVQASFVEGPIVSPTQRDSTITIADSTVATCADLSCIPSKEPKATVPEADSCKNNENLPHETETAACASQEVKVCDEKASQTEGPFRRSDTCIAQEVTSSAEPSIVSTIELPVEPPKHEDCESDIEEDVQIVEQPAEELESQAVWSASDCE